MVFRLMASAVSLLFTRALIITFVLRWPFRSAWENRGSEFSARRCKKCLAEILCYGSLRDNRRVNMQEHDCLSVCVKKWSLSSVCVCLDTDSG